MGGWGWWVGGRWWSSAGPFGPGGRDEDDRLMGRSVGCGQQRWAARLTPKLLILRLTTRGLARSRRVGTGCRNSSAVVAVMARASRRGGKAGLLHDLAADHSKGAGKRDAVGVDFAVQGGLVHELPDGVVDQEHAPHLLLHPLGGLGAQHQTGAALVGLQLIQGGLNLPSRMHL